MELFPWNTDPMDLHSRLNAFGISDSKLGRSFNGTTDDHDRVLKPYMCNERRCVCSLSADPCDAEVRGAFSAAQYLHVI